MRTRNRRYLFSLLLLLPIGLNALADDKYAAGGAQQCLGCHQFGSEPQVHAMLAGAHGNKADDKAPMAQRGCEDCHGPSARHAQAPTQVSPV